MKKVINKYTLIAGNKRLDLSEGQSPRGFRNEENRPDTVIIDCYMEADALKLAKHIKYLETLLTSLSYDKSNAAR
jgi:hypothetical protein